MLAKASFRAHQRVNNVFCFFKIKIFSSCEMARGQNASICCPFTQPSESERMIEITEANAVGVSAWLRSLEAGERPCCPHYKLLQCEGGSMPSGVTRAILLRRTTCTAMPLAARLGVRHFFPHQASQHCCEERRRKADVGSVGLGSTSLRPPSQINKLRASPHGFATRACGSEEFRSAGRYAQLETTLVIRSVDKSTVGYSAVGQNPCTAAGCKAHSYQSNTSNQPKSPKSTLHHSQEVAPEKGHSWPPPCTPVQIIDRRSHPTGDCLAA